MPDLPEKLTFKAWQRSRIFERAAKQGSRLVGKLALTLTDAPACASENAIARAAPPAPRTRAVFPAAVNDVSSPSAARNCDVALASPAAKKKVPASASDRPNRCNSHSASSEFTTSPPANASTLNSAARVRTVRRDFRSGCGGAVRSGLSGGRRR